jgi:hypothetical protein
MLLSRTGSDSVLKNRQGILVELVCWHLLQETFSSLELADHLSIERPCDHHLCHALESDVTSISQLTPFDRSSMVLIQDDMPLLQSMNVKAFKTFGDLAEHFIKKGLFLLLCHHGT